ncbi:tannase/feruloyl esterase family alpha/beta hydrolase [Salinisphaera sp. Q1T1-3]|uniref:tannase/feruloyl esterase family alpha/beta hydrolase n=1 Tax=Salinisphaera sp. Q1T1-3 TaxID=2321229 RepID=UPI000E734013|nr:tannase/feruloyl esterase family alpha/beta hydrolase [Salinisphaera sp. Q1T1-3]RJS93238.1 tannase/feruloyl esterase family alpha/beta hydrolase [Salinisphaera sp. Q1T1-3]
MNKSCLWALAIGALLLQTGCDDDHTDVTTQETTRDCAGIAQAATDLNARIETHRVAAADGLPAYCEVSGRINERTGNGPDGTAAPYYTGFLLRMPDNWNHRFYFQGGGGTDGNQVLDQVQGARAAGDRSALSRGFAIVATNGGHPQNDVGFGFDDQARIDYGYNAIAQVAPTARTLISQYYDQAPTYSYFVGCSNGGRQAMQASQRFPDYFDGIIAGDPGWNLTQVAVDEAWNTQQFARIAETDPDTGTPQLWTAFPPDDDDLAAVSDAILDYCDAADGLRDGMVNRPAACTGFDIATVDALSDGQKQALQAFHDGPPNDLYTTFPWDPGIRGSGWRLWTVGSPGFNGINAAMGASSLAAVFTTPPTNAEDNPLAYALNFDFDTAAAQTAPSSRIIDADSIDLEAFDRAGGKLLIYQGMADPVFSADGIIGYYDRLLEAGGGFQSVGDYARLFRIPGMNHCAGGPATDQFDALTALQAWVEDDEPPARIVAAVDPDNTEIPDDWADRTRPLCPYPQYAAYNGTGDVNDANSFTCSTPD